MSEKTDKIVEEQEKLIAALRAEVEQLKADTLNHVDIFNKHIAGLHVNARR